MSEIKEISASYSRKIQLDKFEPITHHVELTAELDDGDDPDDEYDRLRDMAEDMVERGIAKRVAVQEMDADEGDGDG
jgi:hypothetical protein